MLQIILKAFKMLNSDISSKQIAVGLTIGFFLGLTPLLSLHNLFIVFLLCVLRINIAAALFSLGLFTLIAYLLDPVFGSFGEVLLSNASLKPLWIDMYQSDFWRLMKFNNTLVLGSLMGCLILALPFFFISKILIDQYRVRVLTLVKRSKLVQGLTASKWVQKLQRISSVVSD